MTKRVSNSRRWCHRGRMARQEKKISIFTKKLLMGETRDAMSSHGTPAMRAAVRSMFSKTPARSNLSRRGS